MWPTISAVRELQNTQHENLEDKEELAVEHRRNFAALRSPEEKQDTVILENYREIHYSKYYEPDEVRVE